MMSRKPEKGLENEYKNEGKLIIGNRFLEIRGPDPGFRFLFVVVGIKMVRRTQDHLITKEPP